MNKLSNIKIYDKYVFKQVFATTLVAILLFTVVWIAPEMLLNVIKNTIAGEYSAKTAVLILVYELPNILGKAFPVGLLLGCLFTFDKLSKDFELTIFRAIGLSFNRIIAPVIAFSTIITGLCFITYDKLIPYSYQKLIVLNKQDKALQYIYTLKDQNNNPKKSIVISGYINNLMTNVIVLDFSKEIFKDVHGLSSIYMGTAGVTKKGQWTLYGVKEYKISDDGIYIDVNNLKEKVILEGEEADLALELMTNSAKNEDEFDNKRLWKYIQLLKKEGIDETYNYMLNKYLQRFFHPFVCILLAILGCLLGFSKPREQRLIGFTIAIACIFGYYITLPFFDLLAEKGVLHPFFTAIIPPLAFTFAIYSFYKSKDL